MAIGRPPMPKKKLELHGYADQCKDRNDDEVFPVLKMDEPIACPKGLTPYSQQRWKETVQYLQALQILSVIDLASLEQAFTALDEYYHIVESINALRKSQKTPLISDDKLKRLSLLNSMMNKTIHTYNNIMTKFGVTPGERARMALNIVALKGEKEKQTNPILRVLEEDEDNDDV